MRFAQKSIQNLLKIYQKSVTPRRHGSFSFLSMFPNLFDALRAEPTNKAGAEPNSFELCPARRRKTKVKSKKIF